MKHNRPSPTLGEVISGAAGWWAVFTVGFFVTFPFWAPALVGALRFVLEGLNGFGAGWR